MIKLSQIKDKGKILRATRGKKIPHIQGNSCRFIWISQQTVLAGKSGMIYIQSAQSKNFHLRIYYLVKWSFRNEGEIKTFLHKQKLKEFITTSLALQEMVKGVF